MADELTHKVLVVDDEEPIGKSVGRLIKRTGLDYDYAPNGKAGLEKINAAPKPYALIISDQKMPEMKGAIFLEKAMAASPDSVRFLMTAYADIHAVTDAVNQGAVQQFITKPWDNGLLTESIRSAIESHQINIESRKLFKLAKKQNKKLYSLTVELKRETASHQKELQNRQNQRDELRSRLDKGEKTKNYIAEIEYLLMKNNVLNQENLGRFYQSLISKLYSQIKDLAARKGFLMPGKLKRRQAGDADLS